MLVGKKGRKSYVLVKFVNLDFLNVYFVVNKFLLGTILA